MKRFARGLAAPTVVLFPLLLGVAATAAEQSPEVGYVEDLDHVTAADAIVRAGGNAALELLAPIRGGDAFSLSDPKAKVTLRLAGEADAVIVSQANEQDRISASLPGRGFFTGLLSWVGSSIVIFDRSERTQMTAAIRGGGDDKLAAPILDVPQVLAAGRRSFAVGWLTPDVISIRLSINGETIAEGKGVGGLWIGPELDLRPGKYLLALTSAGAVHSQQVTVTAASDVPEPPDDLTRADIPGALGETAKGVWFAAAGKQYLLEALQHVAADSDAFKPADILVDALIAGEQPSPPP